MKKTFSKSFLPLSMLIAGAMSASAATVTATPGTLASLLASQLPAGDSSLTLTGSIDVRDLKALESLPASVKSLDLSAVRIAPYSSNDLYFGRSVFGENELPPYVFFTSPLESIILPASVTVIPQGAFAESSIVSLAVPAGVAEIDDYAFYNCRHLQTVTLPSSLESVGNKCFFGASALDNVSGAQALRSVGKEAFSGTALTALDLSGATDFAPFALSGMRSLQSLVINPAANVATGLLMDDAALGSVDGIPSDIPDYFAANCGSINLAAGNAGIVTVGDYAFANNASTELLLSRGLLSLGRGVLAGMHNLKTIDAKELEGNIPDVDDNTFEGLNPGEIELFVTDPSYPDWKDHPVWSRFMISTPTISTAEKITVAPADDITVRLGGSRIFVESPVEITDIKIFTADGRLVYAANPAAAHVEIDPSPLPSGVNLIRVVNADNRVKTVSIIF